MQFSYCIIMTCFVGFEETYWFKNLYVITFSFILFPFVICFSSPALTLSQTLYWSNSEKLRYGDSTDCLQCKCNSDGVLQDSSWSFSLHMGLYSSYMYAKQLTLLNRVIVLA